MSAQDVIADAIYRELNGKYGDFGFYDSPAAVVDALAAAGYAVVKLPGPDHLCDRDAAWLAEDDDLQIDFDRRGGIAMAYCDDSSGEVWGPWTADQARQVGAALLAAAAHAEAVTE